MPRFAICRASAGFTWPTRQASYSGRLGKHAAAIRTRFAAAIRSCRPTGPKAINSGWWIRLASGIARARRIPAAHGPCCGTCREPSIRLDFASTTRSRTALATTHASCDALP